MTVAEAVTLIGVVTTSVVSIIGAIVAFRNSTKVTEIHTLVNGVSERTAHLAQLAGNAAGRSELLTEQSASGSAPAPAQAAPAPAVQLPRDG